MKILMIAADGAQMRRDDLPEQVVQLAGHADIDYSYFLYRA